VSFLLCAPGVISILRRQDRQKPIRPAANGSDSLPPR